MPGVMKATGSILIFCCTTYIGLLMARGLRHRVGALESAIAALTGIAHELSFSAVSPTQAVERLACRQSFEQAGFLRECARLCGEHQLFSQAWRQAVGEDRSLGEEDKDILSAVADTIGTCDLESQIASIDHAKWLLGTQLESARQTSAAYGKLYRMAGMLSGAFIVIILL